MSYIGYEQCICKSGHYWERDALDATYDDPPCYCGAEVAWYNCVDCTNINDDGLIPRDVLEKRFLLTPEVVETCSLGYQHVVSSAVYRVPTEEETESLRVYTDV